MTSHYRRYGCYDKAHIYMRIYTRIYVRIWSAYMCVYAYIHTYIYTHYRRYGCYDKARTHSLKKKILIFLIKIKKIRDFSDWFRAKIESAPQNFQMKRPL